MINSEAAHIALRQRAMTVVVATTGAVTLSATLSGYARTIGSFLTDGFAIGMEIQPVGFASNPVDVITGITALTLTVATPRTVEAVAAARSIAVGLPALKAFENQTLTPIPGRPYLEEEYAPSTNRLLSFPAKGGTTEETGLYLLKWYGLANTGVSAVRRAIDALKALFAPGTAIVVGTSTVYVRSDVGPYSSQLIPQGNGFAVAVLTVPWRVRTQNVIAP